MFFLWLLVDVKGVVKDVAYVAIGMQHMFFVPLD
jgi:hypothetical protein